MFNCEHSDAIKTNGKATEFGKERANINQGVISCEGFPTGKYRKLRKTLNKLLPIPTTETIQAYLKVSRLSVPPSRIKNSEGKNK
mmetsp:Transcript_12367/g.15022  ORF Transcript_12367/g.15022 Transcript_12367/m.15022 type:complete len:85 (+) Transcript_12367:1929-2183(+)